MSQQKSKSQHEQARMNYCRSCISEFQRLGYVDAFITEESTRKQTLLDHYNIQSGPKSD
ncbi:hypothetical protein PRUB_a2574 [Pseudoalteromonas rubra]|uniref:Uncharacterized protein n=1 Tax=Pseudoalteromonas rubra TaxID=43658 RepID=A0A8T0CBF6_9GAMM|nr:hypothetical protein PRUB_a2574 [Pseudoalteromonas rubra]